MTGILIENNVTFLLGMGSSPSGTTQGLLAALGDGTADTEYLQPLFEGEYVLGTWDGSLGRADLSTNPLREGQVVLERHSGRVWHASGFDGSETARRLAVE